MLSRSSMRAAAAFSASPSLRTFRRAGSPIYITLRCRNGPAFASIASWVAVLGVSSAHVFQSWGKRRSVAGAAADIAQTRPASEWIRLSAGAGTKGPRLHDWCYLELADLEVEEFYSANHGLWTRGLLIRRHIADGDLAFFTTWCPAGTSIETLVAVEGHRWRSRTVLRPRKTNSDSITTRADPGMGGIATFRW
jgi:hypothetical protein